MREFKTVETMPFMATFDYNLSVPQEDPEILPPGFERGEIAAICGDGGIGKSYFMMELAMELAAGRWGEKGATLYLDLENRLRTQARRQKAIFEALYTEADYDALDQNLHFWPEGARDIDILGEFERLYNNIKFVINNHSRKLGCEFKLLVFDTLRACHSGDENDNSSMGDLIGRFRELADDFKVGIVFIHHASKAAASGSLGSMHAMRGSSVLSDNISFQMNMDRMSPAEARLFRDVSSGAPREIPPEEARLYVRTVVAKNNHGPDGAIYWFRRSPSGVLLPARLEVVPAPAQAQTQNNQEEASNAE